MTIVELSFFRFCRKKPGYLYLISKTSWSLVVVYNLWTQPVTKKNHKICSKILNESKYWNFLSS